MSRRTRFVLILTLLPLASTLGCGEVTAPVPEEIGTFSVTVSGAAARAFAGGAVFTTDAPGLDYGFAVALVDPVVGTAGPAVRHAVYLFREVEEAPIVGQHAVGPESSFRVGMVLDGNGDSSLLCIAQSGTVRFTAVTAGAIQGSFDVEALCSREGDVLARETILATGSFRAERGPLMVPGDVAELPKPDGRFELRTAGENPVPAPVFDGIVLIGEDEFVHLYITVTGGHIHFDGSGAYEQRVSQNVLVDGHPAPSLDWVDRGTCFAPAAELTCVSSLVSNRVLTAALEDGALEVTQDLNGEGVAVTYRYERGA